MLNLAKPIYAKPLHSSLLLSKVTKRIVRFILGLVFPPEQIILPKGVLALFWRGSYPGQLRIWGFASLCFFRVFCRFFP